MPVVASNPPAKAQNDHSYFLGSDLHRAWFLRPRSAGPGPRKGRDTSTRQRGFDNDFGKVAAASKKPTSKAIADCAERRPNALISSRLTPTGEAPPKRSRWHLQRERLTHAQVDHKKDTPGQAAFWWFSTRSPKGPWTERWRNPRQVGFMPELGRRPILARRAL